FALAGSISAAIVTSWHDDVLKKWPKSLQESTVNVCVALGSETRKANDIAQMVRELSPTRIAALPYFYLHCGTEDIVLADNVQFVELLREKKTPHEFR